MKTHLQRDFHRAGAIATVKGVAQTGKFGETLGKFDHRLVGKACEHHMFEIFKLVFQRRVDAWIGMTEKIYPPRRDRIEITLTLEVDQPGTIATSDRHQ